MTIKPITKSKENPLISIIANVVLPVYLLNKLSSQNALVALLIALAFPLGYGLFCFVREGRVSFISLLGLLNTLFTGGFALLKLEGIWFAVKEAAFPFMLGVFVLFSSFRASPFLKFMLFDSGVLNTETLFKIVDEKNVRPQFLELVRKFTMYFSSSFFLSALLNFLLAVRIFTPISESLPETTQTQILNQQIADMTWQGYIVIFIPSTTVLVVTFFFFFRKLTALTGIPFEQMINDKKTT